MRPGVAGAAGYPILGKIMVLHVSSKVLQQTRESLLMITSAQTKSMSEEDPAAARVSLIAPIQAQKPRNMYL